MKRPNTKRTGSTPLALLEPDASVIAYRVEPADDEMPVFAWNARPNCDDPALLSLAPDTRIIGRQRCGFDVELSARRYLADLHARRETQDKGIYTVWEAAELLNTTVDDVPENWRKKLYRIRIDGRAIVRHTSDEIKAINAYPREHIDTVYAEDINAWFVKQGWKRRFPMFDSSTPSKAVEVAERALHTEQVTASLIHSTRQRRDTLTPVIEAAQAQCRDPKDTAQVWAAMQVLAEKKLAPLLGGTEDGLQFLYGGEARIFTRASLHKRLAR